MLPSLFLMHKTSSQWIPTITETSTKYNTIDSVPSYNKEGVTIAINPGIYKETITIPPDKPFLTLTDTSKKESDVIITWDQCGDIVTVATCHVMAPDFIASYLTFQNMFGAGHQAVALRVPRDRAAFYGCSMIGYPDTLFDGGGRHYYENCYIEGVTDFIFGTSSSLLQSCHIHVKAAGYITVMRRDWPTDNGGFVFMNGLITAGEVVKTYLGRPWSGDYPTVIFAYTEMGDAINPEGWSSDGKIEDDLKKKAYCGQFSCVGPSADTSKRTKWAREFTEDEVSNLLTVDFIDGKDWLKSTTLSSSPTPPSTVANWWWGHRHRHREWSSVRLIRPHRIDLASPWITYRSVFFTLL